MFMLFTEQIQELPVQLMSMPVLICDIRPPRIQHAEIADEVPHGKTNLVGSKDIVHIPEPGKEYFMRRLIVTPALPAMDPGLAALGKLDPWLIVFFEHFRMPFRPAASKAAPITAAPRQLTRQQTPVFSV